MAYVPQPVIAADGNGDIHTVTLFQSIGDRKHIRSDTCPDVERMTGYSRNGQPKNRSIDDIVDIDEIPGFLSVLENIDSVAVLDAGGEDGEYASVGIGKRLPGAIDILITERDGFDAETFADHVHQLPLHLLGDAVDGPRMDCGIFGGSYELERLAASRIFYLEIAVAMVSSGRSSG